MEARYALVLAVGALVALTWPARGAGAQDSDIVARGEYVFRAANCQSCHTDAENEGPLLAGGRALETPFGTFYGPNITPDPEHGIGGWSDAEFIAALRRGRAPDGSHYYPVFPYTAFTRMTEADMRALKAYIFTLPPVARPDRPHEIDFPFGWRFLLTFWKWLNFTPGPFTPDPAKSEAWNRGAYLVEALGHCAQCHTPRDVTGGLDGAMAFAGTTEGPDGDPVPNITPDPETGIGEWSEGDLMFLLQTSLLPDGDTVGGLMAEVVDNSTSHLSQEDLRAMVTYLRDLEPVRHQVGKATADDAGDSAGAWE